MSIDAAATLRAVESVASFFLIGLLAYWLTKRRWFTDESSTMLSRLLICVILPVGMFYNINVSTTREHFLSLLPYALLSIASVLATMLLAIAVARLLRMARSRRNIFAASCACSNTIYIGLPVNLALFGTESLPAILLYYMGNTIVFWTLGNYLLASDAADGVKTPVFSVATARRIFSPPILGFAAGLLLLTLNVKIPPLIGIAGSQLAGMITPLSIICIGIAMHRTGLANIRLTRDVALVALGRFVVSPLILLGMLYFFPVPELMRNVFIIQSSLPPVASITILAIQYKADAGFAAVSVSFGTLCALVTVPAFMALLTSF
jgi:predicted permease